jgi:hypothetical protein
MRICGFFLSKQDSKHISQDTRRLAVRVRYFHEVLFAVFTMLPIANANSEEAGQSHLPDTLPEIRNAAPSQDNSGSLKSICKDLVPETKNWEDIFKSLKALPATVPNVPSVQHFKHLPLDRPVDILVFKQFEQETGEGDLKTKEKIAYRIFLEVTEGNQTKMAILPSNQILSAAATPLPGGTDFLYKDTKEAKTLLSFTPGLTTDSIILWNPATLYIVGCSVDGNPSLPLFTSTIRTSVSSIAVGKFLAIVAVAMFYILAALGTFHIHKAQRKKDPSTTTETHLTGGTNYASVWAHIINPVVMTAGPDGKGSVAKLQILFFSLVVFGLVAYIWMLTGHLSDMSSTVLLLMGIAGFGATFSAGLDVAKKRLNFDNWAWLINRKWLPAGGVAEINSARWKDIMTTEGEFDVYRFQMITFSVLVGAALLSEGAALANLESFAIPQALLGILGLSQVVYLGGRLAAPPAISELDDQIKKLRDMETKLRAGVSKTPPISGVVSAETPRENETENRKTLASVHAEYLQMLESTRIMFESALAIKVDEANMKSPFLIVGALPPVVSSNPDTSKQDSKTNVVSPSAVSGEWNVDGCEVAVVNATADEDLPASKGGVAT